jgi:hypothetical protein
VLTDGRQQRQPNHNTTTYCVYWRKTINPIIIRPHMVFTDDDNNENPIITRPHIVFSDGRLVLWLGCRFCYSSVNTICGRIMIGLSLSSISKHNMWSYYDWVVVVVVRQLTQYVVVLWLGCRCCRLWVNTICGHIIIGLTLLSSISKHYVVALWLGCRCRPSVNIIYGRIMIGFIVFRQ